MAEQSGSLSRDLSPYFVYALLAATLGPLQFGFHLAELNAPEEVVRCLKSTRGSGRSTTSLPQCIPMDSFAFGLVSSIFTLGGLIGALTSGPIAAKYGRLFAMRLATVFFTFGPVAEALAPNVPIMAVGRVISGLGAGSAVVVIPIYISEIAPPKHKGFFGSFTQVMINVGILTTQLLGLFLSYGQYWRVVLGIGGIIGLLQAVALLFSIESPKWDAEHGGASRARKHLRKLRGSSCNLEEEVDNWNFGSAFEREGTDAEYTSLSNTNIAKEEEEALLHNEGSSPSSDQRTHGKRDVLEQGTIGMFEVLLHPKYKRATLVVSTVMIAQQFCGINSIVMYGVRLLSGLLEASSGLLNVFVALLNLIITLSCAPLIDKFGRKPCLLMSISGMGMSSLLLAVAIARHIPVLAAITVITFVGSFGLGLGPVPYILSSELVGAEAVGATQSWALAANWIATFVVSQFFPVLNETLGGGRVYFLFAALAAFFAAFVAWFVPETKGRADADEVWGRVTNRQRRED
ncbi:MAG: hypothetical protein M1828_003007 [Chrysothrix sp. TS-e1954]|nr:MAG: hypothetical protein M1828_003007 [Chrysothrix sp. TS-e1954]